MTDAGVRRVSAAEAGGLLGPLRELALRSKASWGYDEGFLAAFARELPTELVRPGRVTLVAEDGGGLVGFAVVDDLGDRAWLEDLWVEPARFGEGVGRRLFDAALDVARELGRPALELESDPHAEGFYVRMGARRFAVRESTIVGERLLPLLRVDLAGSPVREGSSA